MHTWGGMVGAITPGDVLYLAKPWGSSPSPYRGYRYGDLP